VYFGPVIACLWFLTLLVRGAYSRKVIGSGAEEFRRVFLASLLTASAVSLVCYLVQIDLSRAFVCLTFLIGTPLLLAERQLMRKMLHRSRVRGELQHRVVAVGDRRAVAEVAETLHREAYVGYSVVGACMSPDEAAKLTDSDVPVLGEPGQVRDVALKSDADAVLVAGGTSSEDVRRIAWALEGTGIDLIVVPSVTDVAGPRMHIRPVAGLPLLHLEPPQHDEATRWGKRLFDLVGATFILLMAAPVMAAVAVAIKLEDRGPVLFQQPRVGRKGSLFPCFKFRSMVVDAEAKLAEIAHLNESDGVLFKIKDDPRITRIGNFIRRYSLDEFPQLFNVLRGEMSLVGPRPPLQKEVDEYEDTVSRRLLVRPGMTGLWQVSGRSSLSWRETVRLDLFYVDNWSITQDLLILAKTLRAVVGSDGAY
jgi:exopolysaccharide biosynthesis polyprenyl glycosylphosphotransferase